MRESQRDAGGLCTGSVGTVRVGAQQAQATSSRPRAPGGMACVWSWQDIWSTVKKWMEGQITVQKSDQEETKG